MESFAVRAISEHSLLEIRGMSALGHKRTFAVHRPMSALPPTATSIAYFQKGGSVARLQLRTEFAQEAKSYRWV
jgi:hypothetical protein